MPLKVCAGRLTRMLLPAVVFFHAGFLSANPLKWTVSHAPPSELYYKETLFYFYQEDYLSALIYYLSNEKQGRMDSNALLQSGLELSFGIPDQATLSAFEPLFSIDEDEENKNRLWFYLSKIYFQRGYYGRMDEALSRIVGPLSDKNLENDRYFLMQYLLVNKGQEAEAIELLEKVAGQPFFSPYMRYNLALLYYRNKRFNEAMHTFTGLLDRSETEESKYVSDISSLALARYALKSRSYPEANSFLSHIDRGSYLYDEALTLRAVIALQSGDSKTVFKIWDRISKRNTMDQSTIQVLFSLPFLWMEMGENSLAEKGFGYVMDTVASIQKQLVALKSEINRSWILEFIHVNHDRGMGWFWNIDNLPPASKYYALLYKKFSSHRMHDALSDYRDLKILEGHLREWQDNIPVLDSVLQERRHVFERNVSLLNHNRNSEQAKIYHEMLERYGHFLGDIERSTDVQALLEPGERKQRQRLTMIKKRFAGIQGDFPDSENIETNIHVIEGMMQWQAYQAFPERLWRVKRNLKQVDKELAVNRDINNKLSAIQGMTPEVFSVLSSGIIGSRKKVEELLERVIGQQTVLEDYLIKEVQQEIDSLMAFLEKHAGNASYGLTFLMEKSLEPGVRRVQ